jgi:hypothetical protein
MEGPDMRRPEITTRTAKRAPGISSLYEMKEFAAFSTAEQRYIRRSLDVGLARQDAVKCWARTPAEATAIREQARTYERIEMLRACVLDDVDLDAVETLMAHLVALVGFDLGEGRLTGFAACRFLYERLIGAAIRPWLPAAFCAAAALPHLHPERRRMLLQSMTEEVATAPGWSIREPIFFPEWVDKIDPAIAF